MIANAIELTPSATMCYRQLSFMHSIWLEIVRGSAAQQDWFPSFTTISIFFSPFISITMAAYFYPRVTTVMAVSSLWCLSRAPPELGFWLGRNGRMFFSFFSIAENGSRLDLPWLQVCDRNVNGAAELLSLSLSLCISMGSIYCHQIYHRKFSGETFELQSVEVSITEKKRKGKNRRAKMRKVKQGNGKTVR